MAAEEEADGGIEVLTLYAFSIENWNRPKGEVSELMRLLEHYLVEEIQEVMDNGIRVRAMGRLERLPPKIQKSVQDAIERSSANQAMTLVFALSYGGRAEIVDAARKHETDAALRAKLDLLWANLALDDGTHAEKLEALKLLANDTDPQTRQRLLPLLAKDSGADDGGDG